MRGSLRAIQQKNEVSKQTTDYVSHLHTFGGFQMRRFLSSLASAVLAIVVLAACNSDDMKNSVPSSDGKPGTTSSGSTKTPGDGVRRITTVELRDAVDKGAAVIVDVRQAPAYQGSHIKGAIHIPLEEVATRLGELPRDKMIVTYCS